MDDSTALGPLGPLAEWPGVTDILVNGEGRVWVDGAEGLLPVPLALGDEHAVRELATRLIASGGRHVDFAAPVADVRLGQGLRVHVVVPPVSPGGTLISIRVPSAVVPSLDMFGRADSVDGQRVDEVLAALRRRKNIVIAGATGSGKTTLLAAMLDVVGVHERVIVVEDVREIPVRGAHIVSLEARQPNAEGAGEVSLSTLVRACLRMRPDRIVLGECRGAEIADLLFALNTGHAGSLATLHANDLAAVPARLAALGAQAGLRGAELAAQVDAAIDLVVVVERRAGVWRIAQLGEIHAVDGRIMVEAVEPTSSASALAPVPRAVAPRPSIERVVLGARTTVGNPTVPFSSTRQRYGAA